MSVNYKAKYIFDGNSNELIVNGVVQVEESLIKFVGSEDQAPEADETIDFGNATITPGLIDTHIHLVWGGYTARPHELVEQEGRDLTVLRSAENAYRHLKHGVTSVRDLGSTDAIAVSIGKAIDRGVIIGPRVVACGRAICMTGGHAWQIGTEVDGVDEVRKAVRKEIKNGAKVIKLMAGGGVYGDGEELHHSQLTVEEMSVAVEEAHKLGKKVTVHAYGVEAIQNALDAGVDCIEHGSFLTKELAKRMKDEGKWIVPTMSVYEKMLKEADKLGTPEFVRRKTQQLVDASQNAFKIAFKTGVKIAAGTDCGGAGHLHGTLPEEIELMVKLGATPAESLTFATSNAAELIDIKDVGEFKKNKKADIAVFEGNLFEDISSIHQVKTVIMNGREVSIGRTELFTYP